MKIMRFTSSMRGFCCALALLSGNLASAQNMGGDAIMAQQAQPPTLDAMTTSAQASRNINLHIYETLFARSENATPIPDLVESFTLSEDGLTYVFSLRQGVLFHNGKEMQAEDVKASLERYAKVGASAKIMEPVAGIEATGPHEVTVTMSHVVPDFIGQLSSPRAPAVVIPAEEAAKEAGKIEIIGTGPYEFVEYVPDSHVKLKRFENYSPNMNYTERDGFGGRKTAYFDTITIRFMPEGGARTAALQTGEVQFLEQLPAAAAQRLQDNPDIKIHEMTPWAFQTIFLNASQAPTDNIKVREAIQIALNMEEIMAISTDGLYRLTHGWQHPGTVYFAGDIGQELYNQNDVDRAKQLLAEAGYQGEELVILTDNSFKNHNDTAVVAGEQLKAIGMNVSIKVVDWPTALATRAKPEGWNAWTLMMGIEPYEGPYGVVGFFVGDNNFQFEKDEVLENEYQVLNTSLDLEVRKQAFANIQKRLYEKFYAIKVGDVGIYQATRSNVVNYKPYRIPRMWDVWFE
ncbi:MAG: ABC transporter substrate-binding protein [Gammaproteobacteria bacterium]